MFLKLHVYSFLLSESKNTYYRCHSSRCGINVFGLDIVPVSSLFAIVPIVSWSNVIVHVFVASR